MNAFGSWASRVIRVLSPRIQPPVSVDEGSTASTATLWPSSVRCVPSVSISVLLPTPGAPVMPIRVGAARVRQQRLHEPMRQCCVIARARFRPA